MISGSSARVIHQSGPLRAVWCCVSKAALLCFSLGFLLSLALPCRAQDAPEYQVKAEFLYNFIKFVDWPIKSFAQPGSPFYVGVLGVDPFGAHMRKYVEGKNLGDRKIVIRRFKRLEDMQSCHLLFICRSEKEKLGKIVERLGKTHPHTLIVGETEQLLQRGGTINFVIEDKKVRFEINAKAAERAGLKISSKLMQLARKVVYQSDSFKGTIVQTKQQRD